VQCECHIGKKTAIARINPTNRSGTADFTFSRNFSFLVQVPGGGKYPFCPSCGFPCVKPLSIPHCRVLCNVTPTRKTLDFMHALQQRKTQIHERRRGYIHCGSIEYTLDGANAFTVLWWNTMPWVEEGYIRSVPVVSKS